MGVSRATLYAYVSRRGIRSVSVEGSRERLYWKSDVLRAKGGKGRSPKQDKSAPSLESSISFIGPSALYYRGVDAVALAEDATLEQAVALLWGMAEDELFTPRLPVFSERVRQILALMDDAGGIDRAIATLPLIEAANPRSYDFSPAGLTATGVDVLRSLTAITLRCDAPVSAPIHVQIGERLGLSSDWRDFARRLLVLSADHGFEPSSHAVRSVASIGVSPYRSVTAGLLLASGRRTQLGRIEGLERLLDEICSGDAEGAILRRLREGERLPGFGFHPYVDGDPRAHALLRQLDVILDRNELLSKLKAAIQIVHDALGLWPDYALIAQFSSRYLLDDKRDSLFIIGRCAGWIAHAIEQYRTGEAMRPQSLYTGPLPPGNATTVS